MNVLGQVDVAGHARVLGRLVTLAAAVVLLDLVLQRSLIGALAVERYRSGVSWHVERGWPGWQHKMAADVHRMYSEWSDASDR